jgi:hypothetical protein
VPVSELGPSARAIGAGEFGEASGGDLMALGVHARKSTL